MEKKNKVMEKKAELLKKLGFSDDYLKLISPEISNAEVDKIHLIQHGFEVVISDSPTNVYPIIEKTEEPVNSYVN